MAGSRAAAVDLGMSRDQEPTLRARSEITYDTCMHTGGVIG